MEDALHFLQTPFWGEFKGKQGWESLFFELPYSLDELNEAESKISNMITALESGEDPSSAPQTWQTMRVEVLALVRRFRFFALCYIPMFPTDDWSVIAALWATLRGSLPKNTLCIRIDPEPAYLSVEERDTKLGQLLGAHLRKAAADVQPPDTVFLDLSPDREALLAAMKSKWRYNIRLAAKSSVTVRRGTVADMGAFYRIYRTTAERDKIAIHGQGYYEALLDMKPSLTGADAGDAPEIRLYLAEHEGDVLAGIITSFTAHEAIYLYGASSNEKRQLMPAYLLQWQAIQDAKEYGCARYDFYGVPPTDSPSHPMHGLWRFKNGFGGTVVHRLGSLDIPLSPLYGAYRVAERMRTFWYKRVRKLFRR